MAPIERLVRFKDTTGSIYYGEAPHDRPLTHDSLEGALVPIYTGTLPWDGDFTLSKETKEIREVLCPLAQTPIFMCLSLNYRKHAEEAGLPIPSYPSVFIKPADALAGPFDDIPIHRECEWMDYEAELCIVIGKDCKNLTESDDVADYILGYTAGNDVSSRYWQISERSGGQHGSAKWFDKFAPIGPVIVSPAVIPDLSKLNMKSTVNGEVRQSTAISDMIFDIPTILRHLSRGLTLRKGTVIMTGTPSGIAAARKPHVWLKDGDIVEVEIDQIGKIANRMSME